MDVYAEPDEDHGFVVSIETMIECDCGCGRNRPVEVRLSPSHAAALAAKIAAAVEFTRPHRYCDHCDSCECGDEEVTP